MFDRIAFHFYAFLRRVFTEEARWKKAYHELEDKYQQLKAERSVYVLTADSFKEALDEFKEEP